MIKSVGIDVGKDTCVIALRNEECKYTNTSFKNTPEGVKDFVAYLKAMGVSEETPIVLESTGRYHLLFAMTLKDTHFHGVSVINAILTKKYQKGKIRKIKTDKVDAKVLADIALSEKLPSFNQSKKDLRNRKLLTVLRKFEHIQQQLTGLASDLRETGTLTELNELIDSPQKVLDVLLEEKQKVQNKIIEENACPLRDELDNIKGISPELASILVAFLGNRTFSNREQVVAFAGLDLTIRESGTSVKSPRHISKRGDPFLRKKLFSIAWGLKGCHPWYKAYYGKKRFEEHHYYTCILAVARKFLHQYYQIQKKYETIF